MFEAKGVIGRVWSDKTVQNDIKFCHFKTIGKSSKPHVKVDISQGIKTFGPEEINADQDEGDFRSFPWKEGHP